MNSGKGLRVLFGSHASFYQAVGTREFEEMLSVGAHCARDELILGSLQDDRPNL